MARQDISIGTVPGDGTGDRLYIGGDKINDNFIELYAAVALNTAKVTNATHTGDATGSGALTLATVNASPGTYHNATITVNEKGLATAVSSGTSTYTAMKYSGTFTLDPGVYTTCVTTLASTVIPYSIMIKQGSTIVTHTFEVILTTSGAFFAMSIYSTDTVTVTIYIIY